ncbi:MAG TPA: phosphatase PAP2 family protein [Cyclobacteriaceae bacterium]|nr:phosphatase PAP2 family protein [Cyclobacteriaceae bacterium]
MKYTPLLAAFVISVVISQPAVAQYADSLAAAKSHRVARALAAPAVFIAAGIAIRHENEAIQKYFRRPENEEQNPKASEHIGDFTQFAPIALAWGLTLAGNHGEHKFLKSTSMLVQSEVIMIALVRPLKQITHEARPDGSSHSFPSGHTAQAFLAATFLHKEFGHKSIWYSVGGYTMATAVGMCRMVSNRHWASDVLVGAGIGILSTNLVYLGHKHRHKNKMNITAVPSYNRGPGIFLSMKL